MAKNKLSKIQIAPLHLWKPRVLWVFFIFLLILCSYLIYNNYTVNQAARYQSLLTQENSLKEELMLKYGQVRSVPLFVTKMKDLQALESQVNERFPNSEELSLVLIQVNQLAEDTNVSINSFTPDNLNTVELKSGMQSGTIVAETYSLSVSANFKNFIDFIYQIARIPRLIEVLNLKVVRVDDNKINAKIDIKIFYSRK